MRNFIRRHQIGLVQDDKIGTEKLIFIDLLERIVVIERRILRALAADGIRIVREPSGGDRSAIDHGNDAVDRDARGDLRPIERLHQRLWKREA